VRIASHRELLLLWVRQAIRERYYETRLGPLWLVLQPLLMTAVFTVAFTLIARVGSRGAPYPVFFLIGYVPWTFFAYCITRGSVAITSNLPLITTHVFPRELLVIAVLVSALPDVAVGAVFVLALAFLWDVGLGLASLWVVPIFLVQMAFTLGTMLWLSALNALWRDVRAFMPALLRSLFYLSPIIYPAERVPERFQELYLANPIAALVVSYRDALLGGELLHVRALLVATAVSFTLLVSGYVYFRRREAVFADLI
jgi:ABC-type polysaccharide/polyol phosphate export permease